MIKLIGYRKFVSKKNGKEYCVASVLKDASDRDKQNGVVGQMVEEVFVPENEKDMLKPEDIGHEVVLDYELSNGRAYLVHIGIVKGGK